MLLEFATKAGSQLSNSFLPVVKHVLAFQHFKSLYAKKKTLYVLREGS